MKIIDGDMLISAAKNTSEFQQCLANEYDLECLVAGIPTIDPDSLVKRGRWVERKIGNIKEMCCSMCGCVQEDEFIPYRYCPNCGALMIDGEAGEDGRL